MKPDSAAAPPAAPSAPDRRRRKPRPYPLPLAAEATRHSVACVEQMSREYVDGLLANIRCCAQTAYALGYSAGHADALAGIRRNPTAIPKEPADGKEDQVSV